MTWPVETPGPGQVTWSDKKIITAGPNDNSKTSQDIHNRNIRQTLYRDNHPLTRRLCSFLINDITLVGQLLAGWWWLELSSVKKVELISEEFVRSDGWCCGALSYSGVVKGGLWGVQGDVSPIPSTLVLLPFHYRILVKRFNTDLDSWRKNTTTRKFFIWHNQAANLWLAKWKRTMTRWVLFTNLGAACLTENIPETQSLVSCPRHNGLSVWWHSLEEREQKELNIEFEVVLSTRVAKF